MKTNAVALDYFTQNDIKEEFLADTMAGVIELLASEAGKITRKAPTDKHFRIWVTVEEKRDE